jgi:hypothetical protein
VRRPFIIGWFAIVAPSFVAESSGTWLFADAALADSNSLSYACLSFCSLHPDGADVRARHQVEVEAAAESAVARFPACRRG